MSADLEESETGSQGREDDRNDAYEGLELSPGKTLFRDIKIYGSLHDSFFHYFQKDREIAIESLRRWFPELSERLDFSGLRILSKEFFTPVLQKRSVDLIYTAPLRDGSGIVPLAIILEHKAQSSPQMNAATLAQTLGYVALFCQELIKERNSDQSAAQILQPIPVVIYTGEDVKLTSLNWSDYYRLPSEAEQFLVSFRPYFLNMTRMCQDGEFDASPFLLVAYNLMALASLGRLEGAETFVMAPLRDVEPWEQREKNLFIAMACYFIRSALNAKITFDPTKVNALLESANQEKGDVMNSLWNEIGREIWAGEETRIREEEYARGEKDGIEKGVEGLRTAIDNVVANRFKTQSPYLMGQIKKVRDITQLNAILNYAIGKASSVDDVANYVGSML